jgi:hypothetical protein
LERAPGTNVQTKDSDNDMETAETTLTHNGDMTADSNKSIEQDHSPMHIEAEQPTAEQPASGQEDATSIHEDLGTGNDCGDPGKETQTH